MCRAEFFRNLVRAMNRNSKPANEIRVADKIGQAMVELAGRLLHLLSQEIKRCELLASRFVSEKIDVIAARSRRPESEHAARGQQIFRDDLLQDFLCVIKEL